MSARTVARVIQEERETEARAGAHAQSRRLRSITVMGREFALPRSRRSRIGIGALLVVLGCFGFLPVLGFWMIPLGLLILSYEFALIRRWRRRFMVWWASRRGRRRDGRT